MYPLPTPERYHLVLLRNTLIYFASAAKTRALRRVAQQMLPGSVLWIGGSESLPEDVPSFQPVAGAHGFFQYLP